LWENARSNKGERFLFYNKKIPAVYARIFYYDYYFLDTTRSLLRIALKMVGVRPRASLLKIKTGLKRVASLYLAEDRG
jgi:hypothetical protein